MRKRFWEFYKKLTPQQRLEYDVRFKDNPLKDFKDFMLINVIFFFSIILVFVLWFMYISHPIFTEAFERANDPLSEYYTPDEPYPLYEYIEGLTVVKGIMTWWSWATIGMIIWYILKCSYYYYFKLTWMRQYK